MLKNALRAAYLAGAAVSALAVAAPAPAQTEAAAAAAADYDLPEQELAETLRAIARLAGREIIFDEQAAAGRLAPPVSGRLTFEQAVRAALANSGLTADHRTGAALIRPAAPAGATAVTSAETITVTGTRIRGSEAPSPVIVTTRQEMEEAGVSDLAGYTRLLPQNFTGGQNPGVAGGGNQGGHSNINNSATLNLRGLGPDATLTLVNGRRIAYDAVIQGVDIAAIPLGAVERVEVIADGASALYGSDAVAGVANVILRRDYDGLQTTARIGASTDGGNVQQQYNAVTGRRWGSGGLILAVDHSRATPIFARDREYASSIDGSATLTLRNAQTSGVLTGHQRITGGFTLELDALAMNRESLKQTPFLPTADVFTSGLVNRPRLRSYAITPTLRIDLPARWQTALSATRAVSETLLRSRNFTNGVPLIQQLTYENRLSGVELTAEGPLFRAPGGEARLAAGGGLRTVLLDLDIRRIVNGGWVQTRGFTESRNVQFGYGELSLPLVGPDLRIPLMERLTLSAAARYERLEDIDEVVTPKLGFVYQPVAEILLRGSWGKAFKAPTLNQVNQVIQGALLPGSLFVQPQPPLPQGAAVLLLGGGNPNLRSERATTWSATLELRPRFIEGLRLEASYFNVNYRDRIGAPLTGTLSALTNPIFRDLIVLNPSPDRVSALVATLPQGLINQSGHPFDPARVGAIIDGSLGNFGRERLRGVDLAGEYRIVTGPEERILLNAAASYLEGNRQLASNQPFFRHVGTIFNPPNWRARGGIAWQRRYSGMALHGSYVGPTRDNRFPDTERVPPFVTLDFSASLRTPREAGPLGGLELRLSVLNILDQEPATIRNADPSSPPFDSVNHSSIGRFVGLTVRRDW